MTASEKIADALAAFPVRMPGAVTGVLPCVQLTPATSEFAPGRVTIMHAYDVHVMIQRGDDVAMLGYLETLTDDVAETLTAAQFLIDDRIRYESSRGDSEVQTLSRVFTVYAPGRKLC